MNHRRILHDSRSHHCVFVFGILLACLVSLSTAAEFRLSDGTILKGELVSLDDSTAVIRNPVLGEVRLPRTRIVEGLSGSSPLNEESVAPRLRSDPAGYALFFLPTAFTPSAGTATFRDFELFFLNFGYSPTSSTVMSGGFLFPITTEFQLLTFGLKQQLFRTNTGSAVALTGNITIPVGEDADGTLYNGNILFSHRVAEGRYDDALGVHAALGYWNVTESEEGVLMIGAGSEVRLTGNAKFIVEYYGPAEEPDLGIFTLGFRLHGDQLSADIAGIRPLEASGDFLFFPLLIINYRF